MQPYLYSIHPIAVCSFLTVSFLLLFSSWGLALNPRSRTNQSFFVMCLPVIVWNLGIGFVLCSRDPVLAEKWYRFSYLGVVFISPAVYLFTSTITHRLDRNRRRIFAAFVLALLFGLEGVLGKNTISGMWEYEWGFYPRYLPFSLVFLGYFFLLMAASFQNLARGLKTVESPNEKRQIRFLLYAFSIAYLGAWDFLPCFGVNVLPLGFFAIIVYAGLIFWSIYRYQLLNPSPESLARKVLATIADSIIVLDADGFIRMVNPKAEELLGVPEKGLLRKAFSGLVDARSVEVWNALVRTLKDRPRAVESGIVFLRGGEGRPIPTSCNLSTIRDWKGRILGLVLACRDMQESVRSREIIREQEGKIRDVQERYAGLFNRSLFAVYLYDFEGNILDANDAALDLLGYTKGDLVSQNWASVVVEDQWAEAKRNVTTILTKGRSDKPTSYMLRKKDGSFIWIETEGCLIYREGKPYAIQGILRDVTERMRAEEALKRHHEHLKELVEERTAELKRTNRKLQREIAERIQAEERLKKLNEELDRRVRERTADLERANEELKALDGMKDSFVSSVSHELRTPLTSIRSFSEILLTYRQEDPDTQREFLRIINSESERLTRLINDVLDLSRIEAGHMVWNDELISLGEVLRDTLSTQQKFLDAKGLRLLLDLPPDLPPVRADRDRMQQVVTNLLANAVKFSWEGGEVRVRAEAFEGRRSHEPGEWIQVSVSDQGIGIEEKDFDAIFERFRQVSQDEMRDKPKGTGLGLSICRDIILHYGGNIWAESEKGKGSTFCFTLPVAALRTRPAGEDRQAGEPREANRNILAPPD